MTESVTMSSTMSSLTSSVPMVPISVRRHGRGFSGGINGQNTLDQCKQRPPSRHRKNAKKKSVISDPMESDHAKQAAIVEETHQKVTKLKKWKKLQEKNQETTANDLDEKSKECCVLCANEIQFNVVGKCNHHGICSKCSMRMRLLMNDRSCPMCKQSLDRVVVSRVIRLCERFEIWGDAAGPKSLFDETTGMIFVDCRAHYYDLRSLREYKCRIKRCQEIKQSLGQLKEHMRQDHGVEFCELCLTHQSFFIQEQEVFTKNTLRRHNSGRCRDGSADQKHANTGKDFHPMCQFCRKRFYGDKELYEHLERDHYKCHICKVESEYFRNYASLEAHFRREHHLCENPRCLEMHFVVFSNDVEYHAHMSAIHGVHSRLQFNFQVARGGENPVNGPVSSSSAERVPDHWHYDASGHPPTPSVRLEDAFPALPASVRPAPPPVSRPSMARHVSAHTQGSSISARCIPPPPPRGQIFRNQRLAQALGVARPELASGDAAAFENEIKTPHYPEELIAWGKANTSYLTVVERRLERIVQEPSCHSVSLRMMSGEERALMHQLASFYGVVSESFGEDPRRRVSFYKRNNAQVPSVALSAFLSNLNKQAKAQTLSRLKYLPLQNSVPSSQAIPVPARPSVPVNRGWEQIEPRHAPVIADAWSDDDEKDGTEEESSGDSFDYHERSKLTCEHSLAEQIAAVDVAGQNGDTEGSTDIETLKAKVAAVKIDEEEWK